MSSKPEVQSLNQYLSSNAKLKIPSVLIIAFNRPDTTQRVFAAVRQARPAKLFLACDAPRSHRAGEAELVAEVRRILQQVDWPCEVKTRFLEQNLGCGRAVSSAIEWFLNDAKEGIILEDDCLPTPAFFRFCAVMLERYRHDNRVAQIAGSNMAPLVSLPHPYGFSRIVSSWGWATWQRVWADYQFQPKPIAKTESWVSTIHPRAIDFLQRKFKALHEGKFNTWDYQFMVHVLRSGQLSVIPRDNLILNIGFNGTGTHFGKGGRPWAAPAFAFNPVDEWSECLPVEADERYDRHYLTSGHRGSSQLMRQILKWRILWARRTRPHGAVLFD
jgi:uncharacterized membrane protein